MEFSSIVFTVLFLVVIGLFAFCLTEPRGKNTVHARRSNNRTNSVGDMQSSKIDNPISHS